MAIFNATQELETLQAKAAKGKEICDADTFVVRAALKEKGWHNLVCEEAISRGYKEFRGEEDKSLPSWWSEEAIDRLESRETSDDSVSEAPEVSGDQTPEEEQQEPRRVFNLLGDLGGEESEQQEEVSVEDYDTMMFENIFGPIKKEEAMEQVGQEKVEERMAQGCLFHGGCMCPQCKIDGRKRVVVGEVESWLCEQCNRVWSLELESCTICGKTQDQGLVADLKPTMSLDTLREHMAKALKIKKSDKDLAIEAMHKALGMAKLEDGLVIEIPEGAVQCETCQFADYLECDCCLECETEECICCDECNRHPCHCDKEECPICHADIAIGMACPHGCDSDIRELQQLYDDVKNSTDLDFQEKVKFMSLLKEKMGFAADDEDPNDPVTTEEEEG